MLWTNFSFLVYTRTVDFLLGLLWVEVSKVIKRATQDDTFDWAAIKRGLVTGRHTSFAKHISCVCLHCKQHKARNVHCKCRCLTSDTNPMCIFNSGDWVWFFTHIYIYYNGHGHTQWFWFHLMCSCSGINPCEWIHRFIYNFSQGPMFGFKTLWYALFCEWLSDEDGCQPDLTWAGLCCTRNKENSRNSTCGGKPYLCVHILSKLQTCPVGQWLCLQQENSTLALCNVNLGCNIF